MSKISNMLNMLQILKDKRIHSISSLSTELEVSERMIRQYKQELEQAGIYLKSFTGKYGGYQMDENNCFLRIENEVKEKMYVVMKNVLDVEDAISCMDRGHQAINFDKDNRKPILNGKKCVGCHLCKLVCPQNAISTVGIRFEKK